MMENICESRLCTGCSACGQICPQGAIRMTENEEGFLYPKINGSLCNDCGLCARTCPVNAPCKRRESLASTDKAESGMTQNEDAAVGQQTNTPDDQSGSRHKVFACFSRDEEVRSKSSSGGVFTQLALKVLSENGLVFGAGFDETFKVRHGYIEDKDELDSLRRSKYVQSDIAATFREAKAFLKEGRSVLYCGTPCQIAGLKAFLGREYDNLLTCDLACHGVPSPKIWKLFLNYLKDKYNSEIKAVSFRDKTTGWNNSSMRIDFQNGSRYMDKVKQETFFIGFGKSIFNRRSCYDCRFRVDNTKADITLADFWGIDRNGGSQDNQNNQGNQGNQSTDLQNEVDFADNKGVSLIITHTAAGEKAMSRIGEEICMKERSLDAAVRYNPRLVSSVGEPAGRAVFFRELQDGHEFERLRRKYMDNFSLKYRAKTLAKRLLGRG